MIQGSRRYFRYYNYIQPVLKTPFVRAYGSTLFTIAAVTIFILFAIRPTIETIVVLQKKLEENSNTLKQITQKSEDLSLAKKNYLALAKDVKNQVQISVPTKPDLKVFLQTVEEVAAANQATISAIQIKSVVAEGFSEDKGNWQLAEIPFVINLEGNYQNIKQFIKSLEESTRIISITNTSMRKAENGSILMSITGKTYYLK